MIVELLRRAIGRTAAAPERDRERRPPDLPIRLADGLCITGYLCSEIGLGGVRNLAHACNAQRLPLSFRNLPLPGRENDEEFATKCNRINDRKAQLIVCGLNVLDELEHEVTRGAVNILYPFWELARGASLRRGLGAFDLHRAGLPRRSRPPSTPYSPAGALADRCSTAAQRARHAAPVRLSRLRFLRRAQDQPRR